MVADLLEYTELLQFQSTKQTDSSTITMKVLIFISFMNTKSGISLVKIIAFGFATSESTTFCVHQAK